MKQTFKEKRDKLTVVLQQVQDIREHLLCLSCNSLSADSFILVCGHSICHVCMTEKKPQMLRCEVCLVESSTHYSVPQS